MINGATENEIEYRILESMAVGTGPSALGSTQPLAMLHNRRQQGLLLHTINPSILRLRQSMHCLNPCSHLVCRLFDFKDTGNPHYYILV